MMEMERLLSIWIDDANERNMPISMKESQAKALSLFQALRFRLPHPLTEKKTKEFDEFKASNGWYEKFCDRMNYCSEKLHGEAASADHERAKAYPDELKKIIEEGGYCEDQIFNVDEAGLWWKMLPTRTIKQKTKVQAAGVKLSKSRCTVLFGGNASGDKKLKPPFIHTSENPRAMNKINKLKLPVY